MVDMLLVWRMIGTRPGDCRDCCKLITCMTMHASSIEQHNSMQHAVTERTINPSTAEMLSCMQTATYATSG